MNSDLFASPGSAIRGSRSVFVSVASTPMDHKTLAMPLEAAVTPRRLAQVDRVFAVGGAQAIAAAALGTALACAVVVTDAPRSSPGSASRSRPSSTGVRAAPRPANVRTARRARRSSPRDGEHRHRHRHAPGIARLAYIGEARPRISAE